MPGQRYLLSIRHLGYRATVDALDKGETISVKSNRKASIIVAADAKIQNSIDLKQIPVNDRNKTVIAAIKARKHFATALDEVRVQEQKDLDALKNTDI